MKCEVGGCFDSIKGVSPRDPNGASPWLIYRVPAGWCVSWVINTTTPEKPDLNPRLVVLCPLHGPPQVSRPPESTADPLPAG